MPDEQNAIRCIKRI